MGVAVLVDRNGREERQPVVFRGRRLAHGRCLGPLGGQRVVARPLQRHTVGGSRRPHPRERVADSRVGVAITVGAGSALRTG